MYLCIFYSLFHIFIYTYILYDVNEHKHVITYTLKCYTQLNKHQTQNKTSKKIIIIINKRKLRRIYNLNIIEEYKKKIETKNQT